MTDDGSIMMNAFRSIMWMFLRGALWICDLSYDLVQEMFGINLDKFPWIWTWLAVLSGLLMFFVVARIVVLVIRAQFDDQSVEMLSGVDLMRRITVMMVMLALIPTTLQVMSRLSSSLANLFPSLISGANAPSSILLEMSSLDFTDAAAKASSAITLADITDINAMEDGAYIYFSNTTTMIIVLFTSVICLYIFVMICLQIASRIISLLLKICISPFALSSLVDPKDNAYQTWVKLCAADFLANFYQSVLLVLVLTAIASIDVSTIAKVLFMIGALMGVLNAPQGISALLGADVGATSGMQGIQSALIAGQAMMGAGRVAAGATALAGKGALNTARFGAYGAGRLLGGKTFNPDKVAGGSAGGGGISGGNAGGGIPAGAGDAGDLHGTYGGQAPNSDGAVDSLNRVSYSSGINTKEGTVANRIGRAAERTQGVGGAAARAIVKVASATYKNAGQKLYQNKYNPRNGSVSPSAMKRNADRRKSFANFAKYVYHSNTGTENVING